MTAATRSGASAIRVSVAICCALAASISGAQTTAKFAHRDALKAPGVQCTTCHADVAASTSLRAKPGRNIRFNHKLHLAMGNLAPVIAAAIDSGKYLGARDDIRRHLNTSNQCVACHRGLNESDHVAKTNLPQMADCLVCHNQIEVPFSCEKCHLNTTVLKPASHTRDYIDWHSSRKAQFDKQSCVICHGTSFRCMGCH